MTPIRSVCKDAFPTFPAIAREPSWRTDGSFGESVELQPGGDKRRRPTILVLFAGSLRSYLRRTAAAEGLAAIVLAGAVLMAAGALITTAAEYGLAHNLSGLTPATAQTMNLISNELFLPLIGGAFLFAVAAGLAILRGARLPNWLGWVAIVLGIAALIPPAAFPGLIGFVIWSIVVSILMYRRTGPDASTPTPREPDPLGAPGG
jgi:hypothetical protein